MTAGGGKGRFLARLALLALAAGLLAVLARAGAADRTPSPAPWTVEGYGENAAAAERVAFRKAAARVGALLEEEGGDPGWKPSEEDLRAVGAARVQGREHVTTEVGGETHRYQKVTVRVELTPERLERLRQLSLKDRAARERENRDERTFRRQRWAGAVLLGAVVLLGLAASLRLRRRDTGRAS
jgi:hypothetical protein